MIELRADIEGSRELSRRLLKVADNIGDFKKPLFRIGAEVRGSVDTNFSSRGSLFGEKWPARKKSYPWPMLERTSTMRRNFKQKLGNDYVEIFNPTPYFKYHQSNKPRKVLPRRVMLKIDKIRKVFIVKEFQKHIINTMKGNS